MDVSYEELTLAFEKATQEGGMYYGAMSAQAQTYNGQLNALKSRIQDTLGTTFQSVSDTLRDKVFPAINKALDSIDFEKLGNSIGTIAAAIGEIAPTVLRVVTVAINLIGDVVEAISPLVTMIADVLDSIINLVSNIFAGKWSAAWANIRDLASSMISGLTNTLINIINKVIDALNRVISWFNGNANTISKISTYGSTTGSKATAASSISKANMPHVYAASGGEFSQGSVIVGEAGAELLTMNGGVATVTPLTNNNSTTLNGGVNVSVYGAPGQSVNELADAVMDRIQTAVARKGAVWA